MPDSDPADISKTHKVIGPAAEKDDVPDDGEAKNRAEIALQVEQDARLVKTRAEAGDPHDGASDEGVNPDG